MGRPSRSSGLAGSKFPAHFSTKSLPGLLPPRVPARLVVARFFMTEQFQNLRILPKLHLLIPMQTTQ